MAQVGEEVGEHEAKAGGRILQARPAGGGEEFVGGRGEVPQVGDVATGTLVCGGVEFEEDLVVAADEADGESRTVEARREAVLDPKGKTEPKK